MNQDIITEILKNAISQLRESQESSKSYIEIFKELSNNYKKELFPKIDDKNLTDKVNSAITKILNAYKDYLKGDVSSAVDTMFKLLRYGDLYVKGINSISSTWYRARLLDGNIKELPPKEMFHIPFEHRGLVANYRYSISGLPCLYLGSSILACWNEMHKPNISKLVISKFSCVDSDACVLDLRMPNLGYIHTLFGPDEDYSRFLPTWPLIIAVSIKAKNHGDPFKPEYVIPQVLMMALLRITKIKGVAYTSTQIDNMIDDTEDKHYNLALPAQKIKAKGHCSSLVNMFELTKGIPFEVAEIKNWFSNAAGTKFEIFEHQLDLQHLEKISS